ncbi:MAG: S8 family serine peptidase [Chloroflexota bacterium]
MDACRRAALFVALVTAGAVLLPIPVVAAQAPGQLRAGLSAIADGAVPIGASIESRSRAGSRDIAVSIELDQAPDADTRSRLHDAGLSIRGGWETTIEGFVAPSRVRELARVAGVRSITPIRQPLESSFVGPAPALHGATPWQQLGYRGNGVKIGILDGGFDGFAGLLGTELPATVQARCYAQIGVASTALADCVTADSVHGTAVAEAVMDMAPNASLYISNARSPADLAATVSWMTGAGVRLINFSQTSSILLEGMGDGTSPYTNLTYSLVDQAVAGGALFVAAAGNSGQTSWMGPTTDSDADGWVDFAPGVESNYLDLDVGQDIAAAIRWSTATSDYDLSIWQGDTLLAESADAQSVTGDPLEIVDFTAPTAGRYEISVWRDQGPAAPTLRLLVWSNGATELAYRTTAGSLAAPADSRSAGMVAVGAVDYRSPAIVESFSSRGPTLDGRIKPDLVAGDCAPTVTLAVFCGTSEAAPFVTGAAALILESDPTLTPAQLAAYLRSNATPVGSPVPNNDAGYGLLSLGPLPGGVPAVLTFLAPAASGTVGAPFLGQPAVGILDAAGRLVTKGPGATLPITLSVATNVGGGTLSCPAGLTAVAVGGIARFAGCNIDKAGSGYVLRADGSGVTGAVGAPFVVSAVGMPAGLVLTASASTLTYGAALGTTGIVPLPAGVGVPVDVVRIVGGIDTEARPATTDTQGMATWSFKPIVTSDYRLRTVAPGTGIVEVSAPVRIRVNATALLRSSVPTGRTISRTTSIVITTTIRPIGALAARGRARIYLFQRITSGWTLRRTVYANADAIGRAMATIRLPSAGSWWIRSRAEPTATNGASAWTTGVRYTVR